MNPELTQRLIGAVVVTALAAIFVPMMFDDPVEDSSQSVSELVIPQEPVAVVDDAPKPAPISAGEVPVATAVEQDHDAVGENGAASGVLSSDELEAEAPGDEEQELTMERPAAEPSEALDGAPINAAPLLDTGIVDEAPDRIEIAPPKKPAPKPQAKPVVKSTVVKTENLVPVKPSSKQLKSPTTGKAAVDVVSVERLDKSAKPNAEPSRWYIQAGSFSNKENALSLADQLRKQGMPVMMETIQVSGKGTFYRLKVGPSLDKKRAAAMKSKLDRQNIKTLMVGE